MIIDKKKIVKWSSKKETYYTYNDEKFGELKIIVIEHFDDKDKKTGIDRVKIVKEDFCIPELVKNVYEIHKPGIFKEKKQC